MSKSSYTSLTSGLLARKGEAVPATTSFNSENIISARPSRRPLSSTSIPPTPSAWANAGDFLNQEENQDPQHAIPAKAPQSPPHSDKRPPAEVLHSPDRHADNAQDGEDCEPCVPLAVLAAGEEGANRRSSVTFRLNATRYLCLKMAAAKLGRTHQDILTAALDMYLTSLADDALSDCTCLQQLIKGDSHVNSS